MKNNKKIKNMKQTHGKYEENLTELPENTVEKKVLPRTLDQIWGDTGLSKYKTLDEDIYSKELSELNLSDLQSHASKIGIMPSDNRERLIKNLLREFNIHVAKYKTPQTTIKSKAPNATIAKILAEGR